MRAFIFLASVFFAAGSSDRGANDQTWTLAWNGIDLPGPATLGDIPCPPTSAIGWESDLYWGSPEIAEASNILTLGYLAIQNLSGGMHYQVGPNAAGCPDLLTSQSVEDPKGLTFECSFVVMEQPANWTDIVNVRSYVTSDNPNRWEFTLSMRHFLGAPYPDSEWHLVLVSPGQGLVDLGLLEDYIGKWTTVRVGVGVWNAAFGKVVWVDGALIGPSGLGGSGLEVFARFGNANPDLGDDLRIGTMAYTRDGLFSPNPSGNTITYNSVAHDLAYLAPVTKSVEVPPTPIPPAHVTGWQVMR